MNEPLIVFKYLETRCPRSGELIRKGKFIVPAVGLDCGYLYPVYERIEIAIPSDAYGFQYYFVNKGGCRINQVGTSAQTGRIELSRPKVKKWLWERDWISKEEFTQRTKKHLTKSEVMELQPADDWRKIEGSEVEE